MWNYEKRLQYPINIKTPNAKLAQFIMSQYGGPDGEIGASMRYLSQRFTMPNRMAAAVLNDVGTEELAHLEMVSTIVHQLTKDLSMEEIEKSGFGPYYIDHTVGIWPQAAGGVPFNACEFQSKGDPITDLFENLAADGAIIQKQKILAGKKFSLRSGYHSPIFSSIRLLYCRNSSVRLKSALRGFGSLITISCVISPGLPVSR